MASLKASVKALTKDGPMIATRMYDHFFDGHPEIREYFSICFLGKNSNADGSSTTLMAKVLAHILFQFILNLDKPDQFNADIERIAAKHATRAIKPEFFPLLGDALILAIKESLGDKSNDKILAEWRKGYDIMADKLIAQQAVIEKKMAWVGMKKFKITALTEEVIDDGTDDDDDDAEPVVSKTTKVRLQLADGSPLPKFKAGQYVCVRVNLPETGITHRNYILCNKPSDLEWVLDMKHEGSGSIVSSYVRHHCKVGDEIEISAPAGSFLLLESLST